LHDCGRAGSDPAECAWLVKDLGDKSVMLLRNHGGITTCKTVCEAFVASFYLEKACQFEILAQSAGVPLATPAGDERAWPSLLRMLDRETPSYRD
jgi:ribulose-5-phosphate 4-epimerase/fuculose-1-phosphate aldolase